MTGLMTLPAFAAHCKTNGPGSFALIREKMGERDASMLDEMLDFAPLSPFTHVQLSDLERDRFRIDVTLDDHQLVLYAFADPDEPEEGFGLIIISPSFGLFRPLNTAPNGICKASITTRPVPKDLAVDAEDHAAVFELQTKRIRYILDGIERLGADDAMSAVLEALAHEDSPVSLLEITTDTPAQAFCDYSSADQALCAIGLSLAPPKYKMSEQIEFQPQLVLTCEGPSMQSDNAGWMVENSEAQARGTLCIDEVTEVELYAEFPETNFEARLTSNLTQSCSSLSASLGLTAFSADYFGDHLSGDEAVFAEARIFGNFNAKLLGVAFELSEGDGEAWRFPVGPIMLDLRSVSCEVVFVNGAFDQLTLRAKLQLSDFAVSLRAVHFGSSLSSDEEDLSGWFLAGEAHNTTGVSLGDTLHALTPDQVNADWTAPLGGGLRVSWIDVSLDTAEGTFEVMTEFLADEIGSLLDDHGLEAGSDTQTSVLLTVNAAFDLSFCRFELQGENILKAGRFEFQSAALSINYEGGPHTAVTGALSASIKIGDAAFIAQAIKSIDGWLVSASGKIKGKLGAALDQISTTFFGEELSEKLGLPKHLADRQLNAALVISGQTHEQHLIIETEVALEGAGKVALSIEMGPKGGTVKGALIFDNMRFDLGARSADGVSAMIAEYASAQGVSVSVSQLLKMAEQAAGITHTDAEPDVSLKVEVRDIMIGVVKPDQGDTHTVMSADLGGRIDLSGLGDLPLVGAMAPSDQQIAMSLAPVYGNEAWANDDEAPKAVYLAALAALRSGEGRDLPEDLSGLHLNAAIQMPGESAPLALTVPLENEAGDGEAAAAQETADSSIYWKTLNRTLGPVTLQRVGVGFKAQDETGTGPELDILLDGSLGFGGLELALIGLGVDYHLATKELNFDLHGLGLSFERGAISISGAFAEVDGDFLGLATVAAEKLTLSASGGFTTIAGAPSMFIYGALNTPLGGPPFFFVEGLAAGFGYNRALVMPELAQVHEFPFVKQAMGAATGALPAKVDSADGIAQQIHDLAAYVQPELGSYFGAVGVKFSSFKMLNSFILLVLSAGKSTKIDILGVSSFQNPPPNVEGQTPLAKIDMNIEANIRPEEGTVFVHAEITKGSFVLSRSVTLTGNFAFASWFKGQHAGDFVLTLGGYSPYFLPPEHYPKASPVTLTYKVPNKNLLIKGTCYFALTSSMIMAGGALVASGEFEGVSVRFGMSLDLMIQWAPFHYDARMNVSIYASWHGFSTTATASLHVWGPSLSGRAHVKWGMISFDVSFGPARASQPKLMAWSEYLDHFLPDGSESEPGKCVSVTICAGQVGMLTDGVTALVHPGTLEIAIDAIVPFLTITGRGNEQAHPIAFDGSFGCRPCGIVAFDAAELEVGITDRNGNSVTVVLEHVGAENACTVDDGSDLPMVFSVTGQTKRYAPAMWGRGPLISPMPGKEAPIVEAGGSASLKLKSTGSPNMGGKRAIPKSDAPWDVFCVEVISAPEVQNAVDQQSEMAQQRNDNICAALGLPPQPYRKAS